MCSTHSVKCLLLLKGKQNVLLNKDVYISSVQFSRSVVSDSATPWTAACQASLSIIDSQSPPKPMSIESVMPSNHLILCGPLHLLPSIFPSIKVFPNESALCIRGPKDWNFSFNISSSKERPGLIFRMDRLDLLAVQGTAKSLLQHHSSEASIIQHSAFFTVQLSHPYMTTGETIALTKQMYTFFNYETQRYEKCTNLYSKLPIEPNIQHCS